MSTPEISQYFGLRAYFPNRESVRSMGKPADLDTPDMLGTVSDHTQATAVSSLKSTRRKAPSKLHSPSLIPLSVARDNRFTHLIETVEPTRSREELVLSARNTRALLDLLEEFKQGDTLRRHGLPVRSKLLFCGPPGCGKTITAEVFAREVGLPLLVARLDSIISSFLGETASNLRKLFEEADRHPSVLFLDEFDALARTRGDSAEHSEMRRVVNSLLMLIDRYKGRGFVIAATNLEKSLDEAVWRRFDDVIVFDMPTERQIKRLVELKTRNFPASFDIADHIKRLAGFSYAEIERACVTAIKRSVLRHSQKILKAEFDLAISEARRRQEIRNKLHQI
jgi:SpoVK/Ycf46/Vps4 family AAA+-type ATPase